MLNKLKDNLAGIVFFALLIFFILSMTGKLNISSWFDKADDNKETIMAIDDSKWQEILSSHNHSNPGAKAVLVEFGDFQCPACKNFHDNFKQLDAETKSKVDLIFVNFPLENLHDRARYGSRAALAAEKQGKFWEMHDLLYDNQTTWTEADFTSSVDLFTGFANQLSLDIDKFKSDYEDRAIRSKVDSDLKLAESFNLSATPSLYLNKNSVSFKDIEELKKAINDNQE